MVHLKLHAMPNERQAAMAGCMCGMLLCQEQARRAVLPACAGPQALGRFDNIRASRCELWVQ
jgi:hypothetical protein